MDVLGDQLEQLLSRDLKRLGLALLKVAPEIMISLVSSNLSYGAQTKKFSVFRIKMFEYLHEQEKDFAIGY